MTDATLATVRVRARGPALRVTTLFRDPDSREALAARVLPAPWASPAPVLRVWSARTRSGEGAYSIAALLHRHAERVGELARLERVHVLGTDVDAASLAAAARGAYRETAFAGVPPALRARYFGVPGADGMSTVLREVHRPVRYARHDLRRDPPPNGPWQLVVCDNVLLRYDRDAQGAMCETLHRALAPGGALVLGRVERPHARIRDRLDAIDARERLFRRLG
jgi:chemotaxis methyl-accepting protein methylase